MNMKLEFVEDAAKLALKVPGAAEAAAQAVKSAGRLLEETMPRSMSGSVIDAEARAQHFLSGFEAPKATKIVPGDVPHAPGGAPGALDQPKPPSISDYDVSNFRFVPPRNLVSDIRTANGVSLQKVDGPTRIVFNEKNFVQHVLVNRNATDAERDTSLLTAAYAGLIHNDVLAREAAGTVMGRTAGFISQPIERFATPKQMQENAVDGASAYFKGDAAGANNYTKFLTDRFGPANLDESRRSMNSAVDGFVSSPPIVSLVDAGIPITPMFRAAADHEASLYGKGLLQESVLSAARDATSAARDATSYAGGIVPQMSLSEVEAAKKIFESEPFDAARAAAAMKPKPSTFTRDILDLRSPEFKD